MIILPFALILLILTKPIHHSISILFVLEPLTLVDVAGGVFHFAVAVAEAGEEAALVVGLFGELEQAVAVAHVVLPLAVVF